MYDLLPIVQMVNALLIHVRSLSVWRGLVLLGKSLHIQRLQVVRPDGDLAVGHDLVRSEAPNLQALE